MSKAMYRHTRAIIEMSHELSNHSPLVEPAQKRAVNLIDQYTLHLLHAYNQGNLIPTAQRHHYFRHVLIDILTPIVGYAEMLADGWLGQLQPDQTKLAQGMLQHVQLLMACILEDNPTEQMHDESA